MKMEEGSSNMLLPKHELLVESCCLNNTRTVFSHRGSSIVVIKDKEATIVTGFKDVLKTIFLPSGYPNSVSEDYWDYQIWDTAQAFCSTITCGLTTHAVLEGVGVGKSDATPLAAAITWILKDGSGMIGRIVFAWSKGATLDADCKKWRFMADILNDIALTLEFFLPFMFTISTYVLCLTTTLKSIVGVAGGATRASITQHQARSNNMADLAAKDSSQETCVNLLASVIAIFLMMALEGNNDQKWIVFIFLTILHLVFNYYAIRALNFEHLNETRLVIVIKTFLHYTTVAPPRAVNRIEPIFPGHRVKVKDVCGFDIKMGASIADQMKGMQVEDFKLLKDVFNGTNYMVFPNLKTETMHIAFKSNTDSEDVISAYFHAVIFGIALCIHNDINLKFSTKRQLRHATPLDRLNNLMKAIGSTDNAPFFLFPLHKFISFAEFMNTEQRNFFTALAVNDWNLKINSLVTGNCRISFPIEVKIKTT